MSSIISLLNLVLIGAILFSVWSTYQLRPWNAIATRDISAESPVSWSEVNPVGVNTFLSGEVESWKRERTMQMVAEAGIGWIRQGFAWSEIEPQKGVYWDAKYQQDAWAKFDEIVALAEQNGVRIIARLDHTPAWARPSGTEPTAPPSDPIDFGNFIFEFVSRYRGRIGFIQIWNEPNLAREWGGTIDPGGYAELLAIAARSAREADPNIVILSAPMAMTTENSGRAMDELTYWQALYDLGIGDSFDIMSANAYGLSEPYDAPPDPSVLNVRRVELLRELAVRNGDSEKSIWFNEYGWNAAPSDFLEDELIWSRVDESLQAAWTADGLRYARQHWDWFGMANIWYFRQVGNISPDRADYYFRMVDLEFTPRDVYRTVQTFARDSRVADVGAYGDLEAPITPYGSWQVIRDSTVPDGHYIAGDAGESLAIRFNGSVLDLTVIGHTSNGTFSVTIDEGTSNDGSGSSPRTFKVDENSDSIRITSGALSPASKSAQHHHTAVITVDQGSHLAIDGISVQYTRSYRNLVAGAGVAIVALVGAVALKRQQARPL